MITNISAENYRGFEKFDINLSKINLFFGPNNSGKSSIISLFNLISQTLQSADPTVPLLLRGNNGDLGTYRDLVYNHDITKNVTLGIQVKPNPPKTGITGKKGKESHPHGKLSLEYKFRPLRREIILNNIKIKLPEDNVEFEYKKVESKDSDRYHVILNDNGKISKYFESFFLHFLPFGIQSPEGSSSVLPRQFIWNFYNQMRSIESIGPLRKPPERTYMFSGESPSFVGFKGEGAVDIMVQDYLKQKGEKKKNIAKKVSKWLKDCNISDEINIKKLSDRHFELVLKNQLEDTLENIADVGYGCSQVLPILVAGYNLDQGNLFIVQEPEIHLHPKAQAELGSFFYNLMKEDIQMIIETHSEHLLLRLQAHVADRKSNLVPSDISIYYINTTNGKREIQQIELAEDGFFKDDWPDGFFPERLHEATKIHKRSLSD